MKLTLTLPTDVSAALRRVAHEISVEPDQAAVQVLRDALIAGGWLELEHELDEDTEVKGSA